MKYIITDAVECGHFRDIGGTVTISFTFPHLIPDKEKMLNIIDTLDHCLITDDPESVKHSFRYYLLSKCSSFIEDVALIMSKCILESIGPFTFVEEVSVQLGKETFKCKPAEIVTHLQTEILSKNTKG